MPEKHLIGVTGLTGSGKTTLVEELVKNNWDGNTKSLFPGKLVRALPWQVHASIRTSSNRFCPEETDAFVKGLVDEAARITLSSLVVDGFPRSPDQACSFWFTASEYRFFPEIVLLTADLELIRRRLKVRGAPGDAILNDGRLDAEIYWWERLATYIRKAGCDRGLRVVEVESIEEGFVWK